MGSPEIIQWTMVLPSGSMAVRISTEQQVEELNGLALALKRGVENRGGPSTMGTSNKLPSGWWFGTMEF